MPKEIADAFGLHPDSLELVDHDEHLVKAEHCQSCAEWAQKYAKLEGELTECRKDAERYRVQVEDLLQSLTISRQ